MRRGLGLGPENQNRSVTWVNAKVAPLPTRVPRPSARALLVLLAASANASAAPFPTRDQNPLLAGYGLPMPMPARLAPADQWQLVTDLNWGSSSISESGGTETLIVDAETRELRLTAGHGFADRWSFQLQLPYRYTGAGNLDGFIDGWHDAFGLPDGARSDFPADQFRIAYERDGVTELDVQFSAAGIGDISADLGYQLWTDATSSLAAWLSLKLPTGDADKLTGSGAADAALVIAGEHLFAERWSAFGQLGVTYLGNGDLLADQQRNVVWSGLAGVSVRIWRGLDFKMQFDAHSAVFDDTAIDFLGEAAILSVGGAYRFESGWTLDAGVSEDIVVDASPDVVFVVGLRKAPGARR